MTVLDKNAPVLFRLIEESVFPGRADGLSELPGADWEGVLREMRQQALAALPAEWLKRCGLPDRALCEEWKKSAALQQGKWVRLMHAQQKLIGLLEENGIACVILKGAAAAFAYPYPSLRSMGDVDFLVRKAELQKTAALLEENGYVLTHEKDFCAHHYGYSKDGVSFELHWRIGIVSNEELSLLFEEGINKREFRKIGDFCFPALPPLQHGLSLMFHIDQHLRSGLGLRQIVDWMMFLDKNDCLKELRPLFRKAGIERLADTVTLMCQRYLGLKEVVPESGDYPCEELMEYILGNGNFGRKLGFEGKTASVYADMKGPRRVFSRLQRGGLCNWKAARKYALLRPFAWIYQIGHIGRELLSHRVDLGGFKKAKDEGLRRRELLESLGLSVERNIT